MKKLLTNILALVACLSTFAFAACDEENSSTNGGATYSSESIVGGSSGSETSNSEEKGEGSENDNESTEEKGESSEGNSVSSESGNEHAIEYTVTAQYWKEIFSEPEVDNLQFIEEMSYQGSTGLVHGYVDGVKWRVISTRNNAWEREEYYDFSENAPLIYQRESENGGYTTFVPNEEQLQKFDASYTLKWIQIISSIKDSYAEAVYDAESKSYTVPLKVDGIVYTSCQVFFENGTLKKWSAGGTFEGGREASSTFLFGGVSVTLPVL